eukprot:m.229177 g.229177  ORF g.229177 m.229177 type:complete len:387 (-) comp17680_c1_seq1:163-1323(-)
MNAFIDLSDDQQVLELVNYAGSLLPNGPKFVEAMKPKITSGALAEVIRELISISAVFYTSTKEAESVLNSLARLLRVLKPEEGSVLTRELAAAIASEKIQGFEPSRLKSLATLFNNIERGSISRYYTYLELVKFAGRCNFIDSLSSQFSQIPTWLSEWRCDKAQVRDLYAILSQVLSARGRVTLFIDFQSKFFETFNGASKDELEAVKPAVTSLLSTIVCNPEIFEAPLLQNLDAVKQLSGEPIYAVFSLMCGGDMVAFTKWLADHKAQFGTLGFSEEAVARKIRLLTLTSLCARNVTIDFKTISSALQVPLDDIESWIIDVISAGLVEAKIDEVNEKLVVSRSTHTEFGLTQWGELQKKLQTWSHDIQEVQQVLEGVRSQLKFRH